MKKLVSAAAVLLLASPLAAGEAKSYGKPLTVKEVTKVSDILAHPEQYQGKRVKVEGAVVDRLQDAGLLDQDRRGQGLRVIRFKVERRSSSR